MWRRLLALCILLALTSCQPYVDRERVEFTSQIAGFGPKRQLELISLQGDQKSLLLVFNQPLRPLDIADATAPFEVAIHPPVEVASTALEGVSSVRVTFSQPLASASVYDIEIPAGWRSMTGVALVAPIRRRWSTPRPELESVKVVGQPAPPPGSPLQLAHGEVLELEFNQPVAFGSVRGALHLEDLDNPKQATPWDLLSLKDEQGGKDHTRFLVRPSLLREDATYRLALSPGVKGLEGPLRGERPQELLIDSYRPLRYLGPQTLPGRNPVSLTFSGEIGPREIERCLATAPAHARPTSITLDPSNARCLRLEFGDVLPRRLFLTGLKSLDGSRTEEPVTIELVPPPTTREAELAPMVPIPLRGRLFPGVGPGRITSWHLSLDQAIAASVAPQKAWTGSGPPFWEKGKPAFQGKPVPGAAGDVPVLSAKGPLNPGFLAVRSQRAGTTTRGLAVVTDLELFAASTPEGLRVKVRRRLNGSPLPGSEVFLRGAARSQFGQPLKTDANGEALLPWGPTEKRPWPMFVVARKGKDQAFLPVDAIPKPAAELPSAFLVTDQPFYAPEQNMVVSGFTWHKPTRPGELSLSLVPAAGGPALSRLTASLGEHGMLEARAKAPLEPGSYRLVLGRGKEGGAASASFRVCPVAREGESYTLKLSEDDNAWVGKLARDGARHRKVGLRAFLLPPAEQAEEVEGWTPLTGHRPAWEVLGSTTKDDELRLDVQDGGLGGVLALEAFDLNEPALVLARTTEELAAVKPFIALEFEASVTGPGQQTVSPVLRGEGGEGAELSAALMLRDSASEWQEVEVRPQLLEPWTLRYREPGTYRLLVRAVLPGGQALEAAWEREVSRADLADPELPVEPKVAMPGAALTPTLAQARAGEQIWLQISGGGDESGQFVAVGAGGVLPPLTVRVARALALTVRAVRLAPPRWGDQRARWSVRSTPVPLGPLSRKAELSLSVAREDGVDAKPQVGEDLRLTLKRMGPGDGWTGVLLVSPVLEGWPAPAPGLLASFLGQRSDPPPGPGGYPLLPEDFPEGASEVRRGLALQPESQLTLPGPAAAGNYRWWAFGRDDAGRFAWNQTTGEIGQVSQWKALLPWGARVGDEFEAGIKFTSGPKEVSPIGLTATALVDSGRLAPSGYLRTAGVAKPGASYTLPFHYQLGETAAAFETLGWDLGHGGQRHELDARLSVLDTPPVPRGGLMAVLPSSTKRRLPVKGSLPWRLFLHAPEGEQEATVSVYGPKGSLGKVRLKPGSPHLEMQGAGPGTVTLVHESGPPIGYKLFRLQPDTGETSPWGARVYLFRQLVNESGEPISTAVVGKPAKVVIDLVNPASLEELQVRLPLPGGVRPVELRAVREGTPEPNWQAGLGSVAFDLSRLPAGEFVWELEVAPEVPGNYLWPTAQATARGGLQALSGSARISVVR